MIRRLNVNVLLACGLIAAGVMTPAPSAGQTDSGQPVSGAAGSQSAEQAVALQADSPDTVRTNLWLVEALMTKIVGDVAAALPPPPAEIVLDPIGDTEADELMSGVLTRELAGLGYEIYRGVPSAEGLVEGEEAADLLDEEESESDADQRAQELADRPDTSYVAAPTDSEEFDTPGSEESVATGGYMAPTTGLLLTYRVVDVGLDYPETGRRLGLWRQWVARDIALTVTVSIQNLASGRMLLSDRYTQNYSDRVPDDDFDAVNSDIYPFTSGEPGQSGWQGRIEEIVVLGALAALVAVYLANTQ